MHREQTDRLQVRKTVSRERSRFSSGQDTDPEDGDRKHIADHALYLIFRNSNLKYN